MPKCKRCGRVIKDEESVYRGYGPTCYAKRAREYSYQLELRFNPKIDNDLSFIEQHEIIKKLLNKN